MEKSEILNLTLSQAIGALENGYLTSYEYVKTLIHHIEKSEKSRGLNIMLYINKKRALEEARRYDCLRKRGKTVGPLHGVPMLIKDSFNTEFIPTTGATDSLRINLTSENSEFVEILIKNGAIILGKTNLAELSLALTVPNDNFAGVCKNPFNDKYTSGGSSGGSAAGVAMRYSPFAVGEDTGGSIRCPSMCCGVVGFRPTTLRYPRNGVIPVSKSFDAVGLIGRSVKDIMILDSVVTNDNLTLPYRQCRKRIGLPSNFFYDDITPDVKLVFDNFVRSIEKHHRYIEIVRVDIDADLSLASRYQPVIIQTEFTEGLSKYLKESNSDVNNPLTDLTTQQLVDSIQTPSIKAFAEFLSTPPDPLELSKARDSQAQLMYDIDRYFERNNLDCILIPSASHTAVPLSMSTEEAFGIYVRSYSIAPFCSLPALDLPIGLSQNGLPVGIELIGMKNYDRHLLQIGKKIEYLYDNHLGVPF